MTEPQCSPGSVKLLPCPFCGAQPVTNNRASGILGQVYCRNDDCFGPRTTALCIEESTRQWNTRVAAAQSAWQPIETAPKDRPILVVTTNKMWPHRIARWSERQFSKFGNGWDFDGNGLITPIAWQPLPDTSTLPSTQRGES